MSHIPVLEIGGTHVTAAVIDTGAGLPVPRTVVRRPVAAGAAAGELLDAIAGAADRADVGEGAHWGVAIPGPFDYAAGVGRFRGIGKFESLHGVDVRAELLGRLPANPRGISFINDADAFAVGEYRAGAASGHERAVCITLGTGVGSSFLAAGQPVVEGPDVPPYGRAHRLTVDGLPWKRSSPAGRSAGTTRTSWEERTRAVHRTCTTSPYWLATAIRTHSGRSGTASAPWAGSWRRGASGSERA